MPIGHWEMAKKLLTDTCATPLYFRSGQGSALR
jgi:hypothetical protein